MKHLHVALVGGQLLPIYTVIRDVHPDIVVLVCSERTQDSAFMLKKIVCEDFTNIPEDSVYIFTLDDKDITKMHQRILDIKEVFRSDYKITINITSGLKPWAILCHQLYGDMDNVECIYRNQDNSLWNFRTNSIYPVEHQTLGLDKILQLNKIKTLSHTTLDNYTEEDKAAVAGIKKIRRVNPKIFAKLTKDIYPDSDTFIKENYDAIDSKGRNSYLKWNKADNRFEMFLVNPLNKSSQTAVLTSPHIADLVKSTGWFEYEVALFLSQWTEVKEIWMNVNLTILGGNTTDNVSNEVDIIVSTGEKYLFVECKTSIHNPTDIDKFNSVAGGAVGLSHKRIFITQGQIDSKTADKFRWHRMPHYSLNEIGKNTIATQNFFRELSKYMNSINEK